MWLFYNFIAPIEPNLTSTFCDKLLAWESVCNHECNGTCLTDQTECQALADKTLACMCYCFM